MNAQPASFRPEHRWRWPLLEGLLPFDKARLGPDMMAGIILAALGIPEVMGYTKIIGTPVITGLYTLLLPVVVFALFGSSRHLVVSADSATAAMVAAALVSLSLVANSPNMSHSPASSEYWLAECCFLPESCAWVFSQIFFPEACSSDSYPESVFRSPWANCTASWGSRRAGTESFNNSCLPFSTCRRLVSRPCAWLWRCWSSSLVSRYLLRTFLALCWL